MAAAIPIFTRGSAGISTLLGPPKLSPLDELPPIQSKSCRTLLFSPDGCYLAYVNGTTITVIKTESWQCAATIENTKAYSLAFSPKSTFLMSWEPFTVSNANPQGTPNLKIYKTEGGELVKTFTQKKQVNWEPQWSHDEKLFTRLVNTDVVFYEDLNFEKIVTRIKDHKAASYKLSPNVGTYFILCHTLESPGQPSFGRLFKYPNFDNQQAIANKSFFQAEKVEFIWNSKGNNALLLTSTEVDKTGGSYYGKQGLHFMGLNGQTVMVAMKKEGPIYSVEWSPKNQEFCVVYGFMPARATIFNLQCEPCFELGAGAKNSIYYNPHGNILLLGGFGNLRGQIEIWDAINKKKIGECEACDSTLLQWSANGEHFLTATTAPRLRTANGFKIWHYSGVLLYEVNWPQGEELYDVTWKPYPKQFFKEPQISAKKVEGIAPTQPQASKQAYRPPSARNRPVVNFKLHDEDEEPHKVGSNNTPSKAALRNKKKREMKKTKQNEEGDVNDETSTPIVSNVKINLTGDPEMDKKLKNIKKLATPIADILVVPLPDGVVQGTTYVTQKNKTYFGFQGIRYAAPPVGNLRFEAPQPPEPWDDIWDATKERNICFSTQNDVYKNMESEDCLYINVYTPLLNPKQKLPVMVWNHGGGFSKGSSLKQIYGPDFLIEEDVIFVTYNYRLGPFGFLSTGDTAITGNSGMKDQNLALKWAHNNVAYFGGDPDKITIFGGNSGGASTGLHLVSEKSAGLFRAAILETGNSLVSFVIDENPKGYADNLAKVLGGDEYVNDTQQLKKFLQGISAVDLINAASSLVNGQEKGLKYKNPGLPAQGTEAWPVIEVQNEDAFLTEAPYVLLDSGRFNQVPLIIGVCANEAATLLGSVEAIKQAGLGLDTNPSMLIPTNLHQNLSDNDVVVEAIKNMYLKEGETFATNLPAVTSYVSDNLFVRAAIKQAAMAAKLVPTYIYQFSYFGRVTNPVIIDGAEKASHRAELPFIFNMTDQFYSNTTIPSDILTQNRMVKLWTNFAKNLDPTPEQSELINLRWPVVSATNPNYLNINDTLEVRSHLRAVYPEWDNIFQTYGHKPLTTY